MSDVKWEPVEDHDELVGMGFDAIFGPRPDGTLTLFVEVPNDAGAGELTLPPDIRLCRAVPVTWSQEPPDAPGDWWVWDGDDRKAWAGVRLARIYREADDVLWIAARFIFRTPLSTMPPTVWYAPATVPQPPGEVGP